MIDEKKINRSYMSAKKARNKACRLNCNKDNVTKDDDWDIDACLVIVDEISFINRRDLEKMDEYLNLLNDKPSSNFYGDLPIVFSGELKLKRNKQTINNRRYERLTKGQRGFMCDSIRFDSIH